MKNKIEFSDKIGIIKGKNILTTDEFFKRIDFILKKEEGKEEIDLKKVQEIMTLYLTETPEDGQVYEALKSSLRYSSNKIKCLNCNYCLLADKYQLDNYLELNKTFLDLKIGSNPSSIHPLLSKAPVSVNNAYGDPIIQWDDTCEKLKDLESTNHSGPVLLISKGEFKEEHIKDLKKFDLKIVILQSIANLPKEIEPFSYEKRLKSMERLVENSIPTIAYFRPIIPGFNDSKEQIEKTVNDFKNAGIKNLIFSGLFGSEEVLKNLEKVTGKEIKPPEGHRKWRKNKKLLSKNFRENIAKITKKYDMQAFDATSCGVTNELKLGSDYSSHFFKHNNEKYGCDSCDNLENCNKVSNKINKEEITQNIEKLFGKIDFDIQEREGKGFMLHLKGLFTMGEVQIVKWLLWSMGYTGYKLKVDKQLLSSKLVFVKLKINRQTGEKLE